MATVYGTVKKIIQGWFNTRLGKVYVPMFILNEAFSNTDIVYVDFTEDIYASCLFYNRNYSTLARDENLYIEPSTNCYYTPNYWTNPTTLKGLKLFAPSQIFSSTSENYYAFQIILIGSNSTAILMPQAETSNVSADTMPSSQTIGALTIHGRRLGGVSTANYATAYTNLLQYYHMPPTDPYEEGGNSDVGGGSGTFDGTSSQIGLPSAVPSAGALSSGFIKVYNPSAANVSALASYLWGTFDIQTFKSIYNNPIDCIIALLVVPVTPTVGAAATISLGNVATTVSAPVVSNQFVVLDCGSLDIQEYWGAYLDYDPYTKVEIYLPYIGVRDIDVNDIQAKTVQLKYYIDVLSGTCVAMLQCGPDVLYSWSGQCAAEIPITSTGFGSAFQTALTAGNSIGETIVNAMSGIPQNISQVASSVFNGARSKVHKSGSLGSMAGHMGIQTPYLILTRPQQSVPKDLNNLTGYPSNITATLSDLSGYTEIDVIYLENIPATSAELDEIEQLLKDGVIL